MTAIDPQRWEITCPTCEVTIGLVAEGRFFHDSHCSLPRRIAGGVLRCCRCGGPLDCTLSLEPLDGRVEGGDRLLDVGVRVDGGDDELHPRRIDSAKLHRGAEA